MEKHKVESRNIPISYPWLSGKPIVAYDVLRLSWPCIQTKYVTISSWMLIDWKCTCSEQNTIIFPLNNQNVHFQYQCKVRTLEIYKKPIQALVYQNDATGNLHADWNSIVGKQWPRKVIHYGKVHVLRWFPVTLALIYKPIIDLLLI